MREEGACTHMFIKHVDRKEIKVAKNVFGGSECSSGGGGWYKGLWWEMMKI